MKPEQMQFTPNDKRNELLILDFVINESRLLDDDLLPAIDPASTFDFVGQHSKVEVKVRDNFTTDFPWCLISKEKYYTVKNEHDIYHYIIFYFTKDRVIKLFRLDDLQFYPKELSFTHKRTGQPLKQLIYRIPADQYLWITHLDTPII